MISEEALGLKTKSELIRLLMIDEVAPRQSQCEIQADCQIC